MWAPIECPARTKQPLPQLGRHRPARGRRQVAGIHNPPRPGRGSGSSAPAGVVADDAVAGPLQQARPVDDVAPRRRDPVTEHDRRPLASGFPRESSAPAQLEGRPSSGRHQPTAASACSMSSTDSVAEAGDRDLAMADDPLLVDDEDRPPARSGRRARRRPRATLLVLVGKQRHVEALLLSKALVRLDRLRRDPQHLGTEVVEPLALIAVGAELLGANGGEVAGVERQNELAPRGSRRAGSSCRPYRATRSRVPRRLL